VDRVDRVILDIVQRDFPVEMRPWATIAARVGASEAEVMERVQKLKDEGIIRRIGAVFDSKKLGFYSTLCAARVSPERLEEVAEYVNRYPGVTHNYARDDEYNLWFTLTAGSKEEVKRQVEEIEKNCGIELLILPARKVYKIEVVLSMDGMEEHG